jgi:hypothetical protein
LLRGGVEEPRLEKGRKVHKEVCMSKKRAKKAKRKSMAKKKAPAKKKAKKK